ncbi:peptidyl-tRNA hydrolase, PTH2 family [Entomortierella parvispora]|uniref:peptidyl-tRNA hydrolase n=1 Tax=Entomortierella parvispora TaxID=205924 RepID=A0A9P3M236_9FUNG|nr:peptidyl-tRNA hydrolase, PTH2 family [Entomortierella parvispora]
MEKSFTLGQVLSAGAVGLLTGFLISHTAIKQKTQKTKSSTDSHEKDEKKKKSAKKSTKESADPTSDATNAAAAKTKKIEEDSEEYTDEEDFSDEESEDEENEELADFDDLGEEYKMVLVVRSDLGMGKGKAAAQCCHATLANYKELAKKSPQTLTRWEYCGQAKVTLKVDNEEDMLLLQAQAMSIGLAAHSIRDAGRTQIAAGSRTVLAVGPGPVSIVDSVTGKLKLY